MRKKLSDTETKEVNDNSAKEDVERGKDLMVGPDLANGNMSNTLKS